jgi:hypothetical protein
MDTVVPAVPGGVLMMMLVAELLTNDGTRVPPTSTSVT